jgi:hypothetical protein
MPVKIKRLRENRRIERGKPRLHCRQTSLIGEVAITETMMKIKRF